jgi:hypothetical protein
MIPNKFDHLSSLQLLDILYRYLEFEQRMDILNELLQRVANEK